VFEGAGEGPRCFTELLKVTANQIGGWRGRGGISSGISRKPFLDLSILFYPFIYSLPLSFSLSLSPSVLLSNPLPPIFCYFHHSLPPTGDICFYFCPSVRPSVTTIHTVLIVAFRGVCNQMLNCTIRTSARRLNQLYN